jgi:hypothetical protein
VHNNLWENTGVDPPGPLWPATFLLAMLTRGVSRGGLAIYIKKYLKAKEELWKFKYFTMQKYNLQKNPVKEAKILQDVITLITNLKFQHEPKIIIFQK